LTFKKIIIAFTFCLPPTPIWKSRSRQVENHDLAWAWFSTRSERDFQPMGFRYRSTFTYCLL